MAFYYSRISYEDEYRYRYRGITYRIFRLWWLWKHRNWKPTRQKSKAMEKDWQKKMKRRKK